MYSYFTTLEHKPVYTNTNSGPHMRQKVLSLLLLLLLFHPPIITISQFYAFVVFALYCCSHWLSIGSKSSLYRELFLPCIQVHCLHTHTHCTYTTYHSHFVHILVSSLFLISFPFKWISFPHPLPLFSDDFCFPIVSNKFHLYIFAFFGSLVSLSLSFVLLLLLLLVVFASSFLVEPEYTQL